MDPADALPDENSAVPGSRQSVEFAGLWDSTIVLADGSKDEFYSYFARSGTEIVSLDYDADVYGGGLNCYYSSIVQLSHVRDEDYLADGVRVTLKMINAKTLEIISRDSLDLDEDGDTTDDYRRVLVRVEGLSLDDLSICEQ